ncbi:MAG: hypothetical protein WC823_01085 [Parcubacteria group bacterium]|jgi:2-phosphoglycerate kinase
MIYLISGSPRAGKSTLSRKMGEELRIPYLSIDNIRPIVMAYFDGEEAKQRFPFMQMFDADKIDEYFRKYSDQEIFAADMKEVESVWPGTEALIDYLLVCKMDYIIEGIHLLPNLMEKYKNNQDVSIIYLVKTDEEKILAGLYQNTSRHHDWLMGNTQNEETIRLAAKSLVIYGEYYTAEAKKYGFECINTEEDFVDKLKQARDYLLAKK